MRFSISCLFALIAAIPAQAQPVPRSMPYAQEAVAPVPATPLPPKHLAAPPIPARVDVRALAGEMHQMLLQLELDVTREVDDPRKTTLLRATDAARRGALFLEKQARPGLPVSDEAIAAAFESADARVSRLLDLLHVSDQGGMPLRVMTKRVAAKAHELRTLFIPAAAARTDENTSKLREDTRLLALRAHEFRGLASYLQGERYTADGLLADVTSFARTTDRLARAANNPYSRADLRLRFLAVADAWREVVGDLNALELAPRAYTLARARRLDQAYQRVRELLHMQHLTQPITLHSGTAAKD